MSPDALPASLVDCVYRFATRLDGLTDITALIAHQTRSRSCALILQHRADYSTHGGWYWGIDHVWAAAYVDRFFACDPTVEEHFRIPAESAYASPLNRDNPAFRTSDFWRGFCEPQRLGYFAGAYSVLSDALALRLTVQGDVSRGQYNAQDLRVMESLLPHLRRAVEISREVSRLIRHAQALSSVLEQGRSALLLMDPEGRVLHANDAARALSGSGFTLRDDRVVLRDRKAQVQLQAAIGACAMALRGISASIAQGGCHVSIPRAGGLPLSAYLAPFRQQRTNEWDPLPEDLVTLQIVDPEEHRQASPKALQGALHLTPAEARVAAGLCNGASAREIAAQLALSPHTVRDHIKRIYQRTGVSKQSEFVNRAWSVLRLRGEG